MKKIRDIIISIEEPIDNSVGWLLPLEDGTFRFKIYSFGVWTDVSLGTQGPKGDKGDKGDTGAQGPAGQDGAIGATGPAGVDGKSVIAIELTTNSEGTITRGTATLSDKSTIPITVTQA